VKKRLSSEEFGAVLLAARDERKTVSFLTLWTAWAIRKGQHDDVGIFIRDLRTLVNHPKLNGDQPETACLLAQLIESTLERFSRLIEAGKMDEALPSLSALPILYSPKAGKGAANWVRAKDLYHGKKVGTKSAAPYLSHDSIANRNVVWAQLAEDTMRVVHLAALDQSKMSEMKAKAQGYYVLHECRAGAKKGVKTTFYALSDGTVLAWPAWVDVLFDDISTYGLNDPASCKRAFRAVIEDFFAQPRNVHADAILGPMLSKNNSRSFATKEARKNILAVIDRLPPTSLTHAS
jgi:hypothetical protein